MGCRCGERRTALGQGLRAAARGDGLGIRQSLSFVGRTTVQDVEAMAKRIGGRPKEGQPSGRRP